MCKWNVPWRLDWIINLMFAFKDNKGSFSFLRRSWIALWIWIKSFTFFFEEKMFCNFHHLFLANHYSRITLFCLLSGNVIAFFYAKAYPSFFFVMWNCKLRIKLETSLMFKSQCECFTLKWNACTRPWKIYLWKLQPLDWQFFHC